MLTLSKSTPTRGSFARAAGWWRSQRKNLRLSKEPESGSPGFWEGYPSLVRLLFRPAGARSFSHLPTHGLRLRKNAVLRGTATTGAEAHADSTCFTRLWKGRSSTVMHTFVVFPQPLTPWAAFLRRFAAKGPELCFTASSKFISHANATRCFAGESKARSEVRENQEQSQRPRAGAQALQVLCWGPERSDVVGFTGTGYQRSLRVHESDEYNF
jgi:hypothetical protein